LLALTTGSDCLNCITIFFFITYERLWIFYVVCLTQHSNTPFRNFPQGTIGDMVSDASQGISFVCNNIAGYGGDPNQ
jgi:hypothetical protein